MMYQELPVLNVDAVYAPQGSVALKERRRGRRRAAMPREVRAASGSPLIDMLIKQCLFCLACLAVLTLINVFGLNNLIESVTKIIENQNMADFLSGTTYV